MIVEAKAIPYEATALLGERLLVLAPHPDDEIIGCGGLVARHLSESRTVRIVVATDGAAAREPGEDRDAYRAQRETESRNGVMLLGNAEIEFLRFPDRELEDHIEELIVALGRELESFRPDLIAAPSPIEIHPDHLALSRALSLLLQRDPALHATLATSRVAYYEVGQPLRPNTLVDITAVSEKKFAALAVHESQTGARNYLSYTKGLNAYRAMTLPLSVELAEAYRVESLPALRTLAFSSLQQRCGNALAFSTPSVTETIPVSVVIRTRNRAALLREAIDSVKATGYPADIVVVNDGGEHPGAIPGIRLIEHETSRGRSEAMNAGVRAATAPLITFLDDDDLFYPEHLATLANASLQSGYAGWYSDAVSAFLRIGADGRYQEHSKLRIFGRPFDRDALIADNYIPLPTLAVLRSSFLDTGGFDPAFDLFEDWDFLIRLTRSGDLLHVPSITCEIRHFEGGGSITLETPEGSADFHDAKLRVWQKNADLVSPGLFARVLLRDKQYRMQLEAGLTEQRGRCHRNEADIGRLEREKTTLLSQISALHVSVNEGLMRMRDLEGTLLQTERVMNDRILAVEERSVEIVKLTHERDQLQRDQLRTMQNARDHEKTVALLYNEIARLQGLLDMIYRSKAWKLHTMAEKMRGR